MGKVCHVSIKGSLNCFRVIKIGCDCPDNGPRLRGLEQKLKDLENRLRAVDARKPRRGPPGDAVSLINKALIFIIEGSDGVTWTTWYHGYARCSR